MTSHINTRACCFPLHKPGFQRLRQKCIAGTSWCMIGGMCVSVCVWVCFAWEAEVDVCFVLRFLHELFLTYLYCIYIILQERVLQSAYAIYITILHCPRVSCDSTATQPRLYHNCTISPRVHYCSSTKINRPMKVRLRYIRNDVDVQSQTT